MVKLYRKFKQINRNIVALQNWRDDAITRYANKGYSPVRVLNYIDDKLLPKYSRYTPEYSNKVVNTTIPSVHKGGLIPTLNAHLSVKFPPMRRH